MRLYADHYEAAAGMALYPGSLNVLLAEPWSLPQATIRLPAKQVGRLVHLVPCSISGIQGFVFRTDKAERAGPTEQRVVELVAPMRLRDALGLVDGDTVEILVTEGES